LVTTVFIAKAKQCGGGECYMRNACISSLNHLFCNTQSIQNVSYRKRSLIAHFSIITYLRVYKYQAKFSKMKKKVHSSKTMYCLTI
jgi:hypothetical protein